MDGGGESVLNNSNFAVIKEVYDVEYSERFSMELERALDAGCAIIVIEPEQLGNETASWITVGNILHKTAVLSGLGSIAAGFIAKDHFLIQAPLCIVSSLCTGLYTASWQFDPCVKYQIERDPRKLARLPVLNRLPVSTPVVLVRKDDTYKKLLHCTVTLASIALCTFQLCRYLK